MEYRSLGRSGRRVTAAVSARRRFDHADQFCGRAHVAEGPVDRVKRGVVVLVAHCRAGIGHYDDAVAQGADPEAFDRLHEGDDVALLGTGLVPGLVHERVPHPLKVHAGAIGKAQRLRLWLPEALRTCCARYAARTTCVVEKKIVPGLPEGTSLPLAPGTRACTVM